MAVNQSPASERSSGRSEDGDKNGDKNRSVVYRALEAHMLGLRARLRKLNGSGDRPAAIRRVLEELGPERQAKQAEVAQLNEGLREARLEGDAGRIREIKRKIEDVTEELMAI